MCELRCQQDVACLDAYTRLNNREPAIAGSNKAAVSTVSIGNITCPVNRYFYLGDDIVFTSDDETSDTGYT